MSELCSIEMCKSPSRTQCHCCTKNFCRNHFVEHDNLPNLQLNSLVDEINLINHRLLAINIDKLIGDSRQKLEQWRVSCHKMIDDIFEEKCREIDQRASEKIERQRDEICQIRSTVTELIRKQETVMKDIDSLKAAIHTVEERINNMEQTCFEVVVRPLVIDDSLIHIEELYMPDLDLSIFPPPYRTINRIDGSCPSFTSSERYFLIHQAPNLCLMDRELTVIKRNRWGYRPVHDMCWSSTLARFFVITDESVFTVDENTIAIEPIQINQEQSWCSCTCSDTTLYLSTLDGGSTIFKFSLFPTIQFEKQWTSPETCAEYQVITNIVYNNETLALMVVDLHKEEKFIEIRSSVALERLWSLILDIEYNGGVFRCCFLNYGDWLVWDQNTSHFLHIAKDGKVQVTTKYDEHPVSVCLFDGNKIAISTDDRIKLHELKCIK